MQPLACNRLNKEASGRKRSKSHATGHFGVNFFSLSTDGVPSSNLFDSFARKLRLLSFCDLLNRYQANCSGLGDFQFVGILLANFSILADRTSGAAVARGQQ
jgi:hypothetical protein